MVACFAQRMPAAAIAVRLKAELDVDVAERTIGRRKQEWEAEMARRQRSREQMEDLLAAMRAGDATASEMVNALAIEAMMRDPEGTLNVNPVDLQRTSIAAERVRIQAKRLELQARQISLDEQKFALMREREERAIAATTELANKAERGQSITPEDMRRIREIYGLSN